MELQTIVPICAGIPFPGIDFRIGAICRRIGYDLGQRTTRLDEVSNEY